MSNKKKMGVYTTYLSKGQLFGSYVLGRTHEEVEAKIKIRNLKEVYNCKIQEIEGITKYSTLDDDIFIKEINNVLHAVCFMSHVACCSGKLNVEDVLGDCGVLHEVIHLLDSKSSIREIANTKSLIKNLESVAIGFFD